MKRRKEIDGKDEHSNIPFLSSQFPRSQVIPFSSSISSTMCIQWRLDVVMRAILFVSRDKKERGPVIGGWRRVNTRITFNVPEERAYDKGAYDARNPCSIYVQHVAGSNVYMVIGQTHVYRVQVQRMIACYLLTSGCRIEISQIVTIQSVNARNQVNYAPPRLNGLYLGASRPFSLVLKRTNCSLLRLKVDRPIIQWVIIKFEKFFWWRYVTREWFCLLLIERNLNRLLI